MKEVVIVGSGIAAISAIKAIREHDKECRIELFGEEDNYPYNRIKLSKRLMDDIKIDKILLEKREWYDENDVKVYLDTKVTAIKPESKEVVLDNGERVSYSQLVLANGAKNAAPPIAGIDKEGVFTLRRLADSREIKAYAEDSNKVLIIGGGVLGLEMAWVLSQAGKEVMIAEICPYLMPEQLDEKSCKILEEKVSEHNIEILVATSIKKIVGQDKVEGFITGEEKKIECDMVIYSTGIRPNLDILEGTNIKTDFGVVVNNRMQTNYPDIYAVGDVSEIDSKGFGLWPIAIEQGKIAGYNIVDEDAIYQHINPTVMLNAFGLSLFSIGDKNDQNGINIICEQQEDKYIKVKIKDRVIIGAIVIGDMSKSATLRKAVNQSLELDDLDFNNLSVEELIEIIKNG
ncbi:pyridine nucleotide-disulfide oxidoreductase [Orenia metallireducens]|jgi:nitrite reductase (NADH) large subunit|uniref:Pyridine nucleotide-disulfide oxidoreductase n=1 Tax=Orenia metallireducens TaxID=1413210 RepID=A0A1C0AC76_9FIRM|nr:FAD-dependent oxidoreductase [Orenia metallireducens]OCL27948.1 pyridine nucleotide-disulfide oxidoreductase [Orenia metallireducens]